MAILDYSTKKALGLVVVVIVLALVFPSLFGIAFPSSLEISYDAGTNYSTCGDLYYNDGDDRSRCTTQFVVVIGNTGSLTQERVTVTLDYLPVSPRLNWTALDIVATSERAPNARISETRTPGGVVLTIEELAPNRLVEFSFTERGPLAGTALAAIDVEIQAEGRLINSNPRLTVVSRFARNLLSVFGI